MQRIIQLLSVVLKWRALIAGNALAVALLALVVSLVLPPRFTAVAQLLPPDEDDMFGLTSMLGIGSASSQLRRFAVGGMVGGTASDLVVGIMQGRSVMRAVAEKCSIPSYYHVREGSAEEAIKQLRKMSSFQVGDEGIVRIEVSAKTPLLAARIANCYVSELDCFLRQANVSQGRSMRVFIERRLEDAGLALALAQESLRVFQEEHQTVTVDEETKQAIEAYAKLMSQLQLGQARLGAVRDMAGPDNPLVVSINGEISAIRQQLLRFEHGPAQNGFGIGYAVTFDDLPEVAAEFARRYRDSRIQEETYVMLHQQYEYARILEARDTPSVAVLDSAVPPERRSFPRRLLMVLVAFVFGLTAGVGLALVYEYFDQIRLLHPKEYEAWQMVRRQSWFLSKLIPGFRRTQDRSCSDR